MTVIDEIAAERARQVAAEGWDDDHDDRHIKGELRQAAAYYATPDRFRDNSMWPWGDFRKPKDSRTDLIRAGALIVAEIERLDRAADRAARQAMEKQD